MEGFYLLYKLMWSTFNKLISTKTSFLKWLPPIAFTESCNVITLVNKFSNNLFLLILDHENHKRRIISRQNLNEYLKTLKNNFRRNLIGFTQTKLPNGLLLWVSRAVVILWLLLLWIADCTGLRYTWYLNNNKT